MGKQRIPVHYGDEVRYIEIEEQEYKSPKELENERKQQQKLEVIKAREESKKRLMKEKAELSKKYNGHNKGYSVHGKKLGRPRKNEEVSEMRTTKNKSKKVSVRKVKPVKRAVRKSSRKQNKRGFMHWLRLSFAAFVMIMTVQGINSTWLWIEGFAVENNIKLPEVTAVFADNNKMESVNEVKEEEPFNYALYNSASKTYMDYRAITDKSSKQYKYIKANMTVGSDGYLRDKDGNIGVALGSYYGEVGSKYQVTLSEGQVFNVVKIEEKSDAHTIDGCIQKWDKSVIEFVIDSSKFEKASNGYVYQGNFNNNPEFRGTIESMYKID